MKKLGLIGNFCGNKTGGQAEKTRILYGELSEKFCNIKKIDVFEKSLFQILIQVINGFGECDQIIVILASPGYFKMQPLLIFLKKLTRTKVYEFVIGGIRQNYLQEKKNRIRLEHSIDRIYVESTYMLAEYKKIGLKNAVYVPNFKRIYKTADITSQDEASIKERVRREGLHLCTFSRVERKKGIDTAIDIVSLAGRKTDINVWLTIIGPIEQEYEQDFLRLIESSKNEKVEYIGSVESTVCVDTLEKFDVLLFPTHWEAEGFPGTFIDAMASGLPILASNKVNFQGIIKDGYNGWLISEWDIDTYVSRIVQLAENPDLLLKMKRNAIDEVKKYDAKLVLRTVMTDLQK